MHFEVSERVTTTAEIAKLWDFIENQLNKMAATVERTENGIFATSIEASFGSINRSDDTTVKVRPADGGYLIVAETHYRPSFVFWLFFFAALFTYVGWIIPMIFYFYQRGTVRAAMESLLRRVKNEFESASVPPPAGDPTIANLQVLAELRASGALTEDEFQREKAKVLSR